MAAKRWLICPITSGNSLAWTELIGANGNTLVPACNTSCTGNCHTRSTS